MATAPAVPTSSLIEVLFRPSTRFRDSYRGRLPEGFTELELLPGLTIENVRATGITWEDFRLFLRNKLVWMTPEVYVCSQRWHGIDNPVVLEFGCQAGIHTTTYIYVTEGTRNAAATATCDILLRLLATSELRDVWIKGRHNIPPSLSAAGLSLFFQESQSCLRKVALHRMLLSEDRCRALATMSRLDAELGMFDCTQPDAAAGAFVECLQSDRGPVKLDHCDIDTHILASALAGNSRVTKLKPHPVLRYDAAMTILVAALANNRGLVELDLSSCPISDNNWTIMCESIKAHSSLTILDLRTTTSRSSYDSGVIIALSEDQKAHRAHAIAEMIQPNKLLHTIKLTTHERDEQIYTQDIRPYLETNLHRTRVLAIKKADISLRRPLLGLALQTKSVRNTPNLLWMFLSGNPDVVLQSNEEGEHVEVAASAPMEVARSAPVEEAASVPAEVAATRTRTRKC
jgi:hypothetical protein